MLRSHGPGRELHLSMCTSVKRSLKTSGLVKSSGVYSVQFDTIFADTMAMCRGQSSHRDSISEIRSTGGRRVTGVRSQACVT